MKEYIPVNEPLLDGNEKKYLLECIDTGWISSEGPFINEFEKKFASRIGRKHAIAVSNGTAAIDAAIEALEIGKDDEVIMPTFTIISCVGQIIRNGATPVFIDCSPNTWNMDVSQIEEKINKKTKAIMVVHIYGLPVEMDPIIEIANRYGLKIIEDAAEMHGQEYKGKACGSFGDISTFSFYPNKHITTGEGGMILTDDDEIANKCRSLRNLCFKPGKRFIHDDLGWNLRMTNLQAAIGLAQLERLDEFVIRKRKMGSIYTELLNEEESLQLPIAKTDYADNIYWVYGIVLNKKNINADEMISKLNEEGVGARPFFYPLHQQPVMKKYNIKIEGSYINSEDICRKGLYLPSGMSMDENKIHEVVARLKKILRNNIL
jgi:perosamine synthetase